MAGTQIKDNGSWTDLKQSYVKDSGVWKPTKKLYAKDSGVWKIVDNFYNEIETSSTGNDDSAVAHVTEYKHDGSSETSSTSRGYTVITLNDNFEVTDTTTYDVYGSTTAAANMKSYLDGLDYETLVVVISHDAIQYWNYTFLHDTMALFGNTDFWILEYDSYRAAHMFVGRKCSGSFISFCRQSDDEIPAAIFKYAEVGRRGSAFAFGTEWAQPASSFEEIVEKNPTVDYDFEGVRNFVYDSQEVYDQSCLFIYDNSKIFAEDGWGQATHLSVHQAILSATHRSRIYRDTSGTTRPVIDGVTCCDGRWLSVPALYEQKSYEPAYSLTMMAWIYPTAYPSTGGRGTIFTKRNCYYFQIDDSGYLQYYNYGVGGTPMPNDYVESSSAVPLNTWTHVAVVKGTGQTVLFYINGELDRTIGGAAPVDIQSSTTDVHFGWENSVGYRDFTGYFNDMRLYRRSLVDHEIYSIANHNASVYPTDNNGNIFQLDFGYSALGTLRQINSQSKLRNYGMLDYVTDIDNPKTNYGKSNKHMTFFYGGSPEGYLQTLIPNWAKRAEILYGEGNLANSTARCEIYHGFYSGTTWTSPTIRDFVYTFEGKIASLDLDLSHSTRKHTEFRILEESIAWIEWVRYQKDYGNGYGQSSSNPGVNGLDILANNPDVAGHDGYYWVENYNGDPIQCYFIMTDYGGLGAGWAVVAAANMNGSGCYPTDIYNNTNVGADHCVSGQKQDAKFGINLYWPKFNEYGTTEIYAHDVGEATNDWTYNVFDVGGGYSDVFVNMVGRTALTRGYTLSASLVTDGFTTAMVNNWADCNAHAHYTAYNWFGNCHTFYWWGQRNLMGGCSGSGCFYTDQNQANGFMNVTNYGSSWAQSSRRLASLAHQYRNTDGQIMKLCFIVR